MNFQGTDQFGQVVQITFDYQVMRINDNNFMLRPDSQWRWLFDQADKLIGFQAGSLFFYSETDQLYLDQISDWKQNYILVRFGETIQIYKTDIPLEGFISKIYFQQVVLVEDQYKKVFCMKSMIKNRQSLNEISMLRQLKHENIISLFEVYENQRQFFLILEYIETIKITDHDDIKTVLEQLLNLIVYFNQQRIVHRDLKEDNILIDSKLNVKIIDFEYAMKIDQERFSISGTPSYIPPEVLQKQRYNEKSDLFSLGVVMFQMYTNKNLFQLEDMQELIIFNRNFECDKKNIPRIPDNGDDLIFKLLKNNSAERISAKEALQHYYFKCSEDESEIQQIPRLGLFSPYQKKLYTPTSFRSTKGTQEKFYV
ncbi:hypothetical protein pb186bvf_015734 [Paramecium bursaria]